MVYFETRQLYWKLYQTYYLLHHEWRAFDQVLYWNFSDEFPNSNQQQKCPQIASQHRVQLKKYWIRKFLFYSKYIKSLDLKFHHRSFHFIFFLHSKFFQPNFKSSRNLTRNWNSGKSVFDMKIELNALITLETIDRKWVKNRLRHQIYK